MKKVLIFYASYGGGHLNAATSINEYIKSNYTDVSIEMIDCVKYVNSAIDKLSTTAYRETAKYAPWVWGRVYSDSNKGPLAHLTSRSNQILAIRLLKLLKSKKPDIIISTHPFGSQMCNYLKRKNKINCKIATIMTDFAPHNQWLVGSNYTDYFFVAHNKMKDYLSKNSISTSKIFVTGIPLSNRFLEDYNRISIFKHLGLNKDLKTVLFFGGGEFGLGKTKTFDLFESLISNCKAIQVVAIAGKNTKMKQAFEDIVLKNNCSKNVKVLSFTTKIPELMAISDIVITKPGGLTTTECLASNLPMIIINPIPGQEEENAEFLENNNVGIWIKKSDDISLIVNDLINDSKKLDLMKNNSKKLSKSNATSDICNLLLRH